MFKKLKIVIIATGISCCVVSLYAGINSITLSNWKALSKQTHIVAGKPGQLQFQFTLDYKVENIMKLIKNSKFERMK